jgi:hypothetical protein
MAGRRFNQKASTRAISAEEGHSAPGRASAQIHPLLKLQRAAGNQAVSRYVRDALRTPGQPLNPTTQTEMEARLGHDFSQVRVHADALAGESAETLGAKAYTVGDDIVFGHGKYRPATTAGQQLLSHELAHVVQQGRGGPSPEFHPGAVHEQQAETAAHEVAGTTGPVTIAGATGMGLARQADPEIEEAIERELTPSDTPSEPIKPSRPGGPAQVGPQKALTPAELIDEHVLGPRAFEEVGGLKARLAKQERLLTSNPGDVKLKQRVLAMRERVRVLEGRGLDPQLTGTNLPGHGNVNTRAAIQLVDADGNQIALARGEVRPGHQHAEEVALANLRRQLGKRKLPPGTRMDVGGNQVVCGPTCKPAIRQFAVDYGIKLDDIDSSVRQRPRMQGEGLASGKTTEQTGLRSDVPKGSIKTEPLFKPGGRGGGPGGGPAPTTSEPVAKPSAPSIAEKGGSVPSPAAVKPAVPATKPGLAPPTTAGTAGPESGAVRGNAALRATAEEPPSVSRGTGLAGRFRTRIRQIPSAKVGAHVLKSAGQAGLGIIAGVIRARFDESMIDTQLRWHEEYINQRLEALLPTAIDFALTRPNSPVYLNFSYRIMQPSTYEPELHRRQYDIPVVPRDTLKFGIDTESHEGELERLQDNSVILSRFDWVEIGTAITLEEFIERHAPELYDEFLLERRKALEEFHRDFPAERPLSNIRIAPREDPLRR